MEEKCNESLLYSGEILKNINWEESNCVFRNGISPFNPGKSLIMRPLCIADYDRGYLELLSQLTRVGDISKEDFIKQFNSMKSCPDTYYVTVLEDVSTEKIIGTATLFIEKKFIHQCATKGRIEDVVVNNEYRGLQLGKLLVESMTLLGKYLKCYKMSLECKDEKICFYTNFGYKKDPGNNYMIQRYHD